MSSLRLGRLKAERKAWRKDHPYGFIARPQKNKDGSSNLLKWDCAVPGKEGGVWAGGLYRLTLDFSKEGGCSDYPQTPPVVKFTPPLNHPNIYSGGKVCLSITNMPPSGTWRASITVKAILLGLQTLLDNPNENDPANSAAAHQYRWRRSEYDKKAKETASRFAPPK
jgi:ubiquitin-conjugating enzyme E2 I